MYTGKLGNELTIEQGQEAAYQTIINCLAVMKAHLGDLDRVVECHWALSIVLQVSRTSHM